MNPLLAQETGLKLPSPPATSDPITWITLFLVVVLVFVVFQQQRDRTKERAEERASAERLAAAAQAATAAAIAAFRIELQAMRQGYDEAVATFRSELLALREEHLEQIRLRDDREGDRNGRVHQRFDDMAKDLAVILERTPKG